MVVFGVFFISLIAVIFLFANKAREASVGAPLICLTFGSDEKITESLSHLGDFVRRLPKVMVNVAIFFAVKWSLQMYEIGRAFVYPKIAHIVDAVRGHNIPKNRGAVSIYWSAVSERERGK